MRRLVHCRNLKYIQEYRAILPTQYDSEQGVN